ncbi:NUDIX domain-containing protein [Segatella maculosa]|uniref:NUDIX hydrolase n=1 Tax=Segatella maculosa TaxID=439703 RepID=UPI0028D49595|nr:NUDIX domain-containing protein [Segatella maculosa]
MMLLEKMAFCPICGSSRFPMSGPKSRRCTACGFEYFMNPAAANVALILNERQELLVVRRKNEPERGTLDLPGGFADMEETAEEGVIREVKEETGLEVTSVCYLFSFANRYAFSGVIVPTLDQFFACSVADTAVLQASDDAAEAFWLPLNRIVPAEFGLVSIRRGIEKYLKIKKPTA